MTLLFIDGFDVGDVPLNWTVGATSAPLLPTVSTITPYSYGRSVSIAAGNWQQSLKRGITPSAEVIVGVQFRWDADTIFTGASHEVGICALYTDGGSVQQLRLAMTESGTLRLYRGDGTLLAFGPAAQLLAGVYYFLEIKATVDDSVGTCIARVNEAEAINFTGDTRNGGASTAIDMVSLHLVGFAGSPPTTYFDDLYVCNGIDDGIGPANNDFLGLGRVQTLLPSGAGTDTDLTPVGSPNNWENVNDVPYSTSDYNSSSVVGDRDTYQLTDLDPATVSIAGIQTVVMAQATDASARIKAALRSGGSLYYDPAVALNGQPSDVSVVVRETDPDTDLAWTVSGVNALEAGVEITA